MVYVDGTNILNVTSETDQNLTKIFYPVCSCGPHSVSVSAVNRCGCEGPRSSNIMLEALQRVSDPGNVYALALACYYVCMYGRVIGRIREL